MSLVTFYIISIYTHNSNTLPNNAFITIYPTYIIIILKLNISHKKSIFPYVPYVPSPWGNEDTQEILSILAKHNVKVTFFMTGGWVESFPDDVKAIHAAGHDLGNHSENHKDMPTLSDTQQKEELSKVHNKVKELTGYDMFLFRPPYGSYNNSLITNAKALGYYTIQWDVDSLDWKNYGVESIIDTVCNHKHLGNGSIILCHNGAKYTAQALDTIITSLKEKGYEFVPLSELIYKENYHMNHEGRQIPDANSSTNKTNDTASDHTTETGRQ